MTAKNRNSMEGGVMRRAEGLGKHENAMELLRNLKKILTIENEWKHDSQNIPSRWRRDSKNY